MTLIKTYLAESQNYLDKIGVPTLTTARIEKYLNSDGKSPVIVLWNGITSSELINRLNIRGIHRYLSITNKWDDCNNTFELLLEDMSKNRIEIFKISLKEFNKPGSSSLNLYECHSLICNTTHDNITCCHDLVTDVIYTKCIFNFIVRSHKPSKMYAYCSDKPIRLTKKKKNKQS